MKNMKLNAGYARALVSAALTEDIGQGDATTQATIPAKSTAVMRINARQSLVVCGYAILKETFRQLDDKVTVIFFEKEGRLVPSGTALAEIKGNARALLTGERVALNLMQRMSGVATLTRRYVHAVAGTRAVILDTRKTMPGLRQLDKYAVWVGGGQNHRMGLYDMVMIKDNHIAVCGSLTKAVKKARRHSKLSVEVECDTLEQVKEAIEAGPDRILLDNMDVPRLKQAVELVAGRIPLEASGGITLENVHAIAETGVEYISLGTLTHSAPAVDIGADVVITT